ncbi:uncharacterized protein LY79DRAFT_35694 [Colletotrichum navitas]|uniref:Uncharacterized protein n=1 Tax=Colletotrichum navitas TaxID=681940 RepID=A0AAD8V8G8_9PEZI|nr:uncharacterized protein LY79DRAFT_35694 [Colletotrichum navitas]KAK1596914.1 hypothetical protein LY79DRAFT_35694 [Colletotrichum navitas]
MLPKNRPHHDRRATRATDRNERSNARAAATDAAQNNAGNPSAGAHISAGRLSVGRGTDGVMVVQVATAYIGITLGRYRSCSRRVFPQAAAQGQTERRACELYVEGETSCRWHPSQNRESLYNSLATAGNTKGEVAHRQTRRGGAMEAYHPGNGFERKMMTIIAIIAIIVIQKSLFPGCQLIRSLGPMGTRPPRPTVSLGSRRGMPEPGIVRRRSLAYAR